MVSKSREGSRSAPRGDPLGWSISARSSSIAFSGRLCERLRRCRVELGSAAALNFAPGLGKGLCLPVGAVGGDRVERVGDGEKILAPIGISSALQAPRIAAAIEVFLVAEDNLGGVLEETEFSSAWCSRGRSARASPIAPRKRELSRLGENRVRDRHLADVMQEGAAGDHFDFGRVDSSLARSRSSKPSLVWNGLRSPRPSGRARCRAPRA